MPTQQRINDLTTYVAQWKAALAQLTEYRDTLLKINTKGVSLTDEAGNDLLQQRINTNDAAVLEHQRILIGMQSLLDRALSGENV
ncbi:MAG: hypothetical protein HOP06_10000 [Methylotenera sp.]|nr:hypothetical protein [Methylotenera sp.]